MLRSIRLICVLFLIGTVGSFAFAQKPSETPPPPGPSQSLKIPEMKTMVLPNGLTIAVVRKPELPLVTASLLIKAGANDERPVDAGLAFATASLLTKGTANMNAAELAEQVDFLGANLDSGAQGSSTYVNLDITKDKLPLGLSIMSESLLQPAFSDSELQLFQKQALDDFDVSLAQPSSLLQYVSNVYTLGKHLGRGTPHSIKSFTSEKLRNFYKTKYLPQNSVLVFTGDITPEQAFSLAQKYFGGWTKGKVSPKVASVPSRSVQRKMPMVKEIIVVDLPKSGQAAVGFAKGIPSGRTNCNSSDCVTAKDFYSANVMNSVLGGGYSSRLNQEIRLKRGLSYGAGSGFNWNPNDAIFTASAQTKNESADQVAELMKVELERLVNEPVAKSELVPRKAVLTGNFGRSLQSNSGLANQLRNLFFFNLKPAELNGYLTNIDTVTTEDINKYARNLTGGTIIIVGDSSVFLNGLKKRFPGTKIRVLSAKDLDLDSGATR